MKGDEAMTTKELQEALYNFKNAKNLITIYLKLFSDMSCAIYGNDERLFGFNYINELENFLEPYLPKHFKVLLHFTQDVVGCSEEEVRKRMEDKHGKCCVYKIEKSI